MKSFSSLFFKGLKYGRLFFLCNAKDEGVMVSITQSIAFGLFYDGPESSEAFIFRKVEYNHIVLQRINLFSILNKNGQLLNLKKFKKCPF